MDRTKHYESQTKGDLIERIVELEEGLIRGLDLRERGPLTAEQAEAVADGWLASLPEGAAFKGELTITYLDDSGQVWFTLMHVGASAP